MTSRSSAGSASRRAATRPRIVVGRLPASSLPRSLITAASCSMKSGFPSAASTTCDAFVSAPSRCSASCAASVAVERLERAARCRRAGRRPTRAGRRAAPALRCVKSRTGRSCRRVGEELDQVEERGVGPVDVLEDERRCLVPCAGLHEDADRLEEAVAVGRGRLVSKPSRIARCPATASASSCPRAARRGCAAFRRDARRRRCRRCRRAPSPVIANAPYALRSRYGRQRPRRRALRADAMRSVNSADEPRLSDARRRRGP